MILRLYLKALIILAHNRKAAALPQHIVASLAWQGHFNLENGAHEHMFASSKQYKE